MSCATLGRGTKTPHRAPNSRLIGLPRLGDQPLLSAEQERALGRAVASGDDSARDRLVRSNLRLVITIARQFLGRGLELDDLVGEGNLGLIRAAAQFDPGFGTRFSTYAGYWIREAIQRALTDTASAVRVPAHMAQRLREYRRAERQLVREGDQSPTVDRVAERMGLSEGQREMLGQALRARRLTAVGDHEEGEGRAIAELGDPGECPSAPVERADEARGLRSRMAQRLTARERRMLELRYGLVDGEPLTLKEVGRRLGCTREWVRKVEARAVAKLRDEPEGPGRDG
jgi:RNA polymerase primary sigma factor